MLHAPTSEVQLWACPTATCSGAACNNTQSVRPRAGAVCCLAVPACALLCLLLFAAAHLLRAPGPRLPAPHCPCCDSHSCCLAVHPSVMLPVGACLVGRSFELLCPRVGFVPAGSNWDATPWSWALLFLDVAFSPFLSGCLLVWPAWLKAVRLTMGLVI